MQQTPENPKVPLGKPFWLGLSKWSMRLAIPFIAFADWGLYGIWLYYVSGLIFHQIHTPFWRTVYISIGLYFVRSFLLLCLEGLAGIAERLELKAEPKDEAITHDEPIPDQQAEPIFHCPYCEFTCPEKDVEATSEHLLYHEELLLSKWDTGNGKWQCPWCDYSCQTEEREAQFDHLKSHDKPN
jgi:hypothetical protein